MGELRMDSRPFPAPLPHGNPVPFPPPPVSRLRATKRICGKKKSNRAIVIFSSAISLQKYIWINIIWLNVKLRGRQ